MADAINSFFDHGGWLAHLSYLLLVLSMLNRRTLWLRLGVIGSAIAGIIYAAVFIHDPNLAFWEAMLLIVNVVQIARFEWSERRTRFDDRDKALVAALVPDVPRLHARALIDQGYWINARAGEEIARENEAVSHLFYLHDGKAEVRLAGAPVGTCSAGDLIGDATALSGDPATATVILATPSMLWSIPAPQLRRYLDTHPDLRPALERKVSQSLKAKLVAANQRLAASN